MILFSSEEHFQISINKVRNSDNLRADSLFFIDEVLRIFPTNEQVDQHNKRVLLPKKGLAMSEIKAQDALVDATWNIKPVNLDNIITKNKD